MKRAFPLADVLGVLHTQHFSRSEHGVSDLVGFLTSGPKMPPGSQILLSGVMQVTGDLRKQLPDLTAATQPPAEFATEADVWAWVEQMEQQHGTTIEVEPIYS
jgi:hypothetical protein